MKASKNKAVRLERQQQTVGIYVYFSTFLHHNVEFKPEYAINLSLVTGSILL